jgi:hypothetical protein
LEACGPGQQQQPQQQRAAKAFDGPVALVARLDANGFLYVVERVNRCVYAVCKLGSWAKLEQLRAAAAAAAATTAITAAVSVTHSGKDNSGIVGDQNEDGCDDGYGDDGDDDDQDVDDGQDLALPVPPAAVAKRPAGVKRRKLDRTASSAFLAARLSGGGGCGGGAAAAATKAQAAACAPSSHADQQQEQLVSCTVQQTQCLPGQALPSPATEISPRQMPTPPAEDAAPAPATSIAPKIAVEPSISTSASATTGLDAREMFRTLQSQYLETLYLSKVSDEVATRGWRIPLCFNFLALV